MIDMTTQTCSYFTLFQCLSEVENCLVNAQAWKSDNVIAQKTFDKYYANRNFIHLFGDIIDCKVSLDSPDLVNEFLSNNGFPIQLNDILSNGRKIFIASILKLLCQWDWTAIGSPLYLDEQYAGIIFPSFMKFSICPLHPDEPIACVPLLNGDTLYIQQSCHDDTEDPWQHAYNAHDFLWRRCDEYDGLHVPSLSIEHEVDISYLLGSRIEFEHDGIAEIVQALHYDKFCMNECGVKLESATALGVAVSGYMPPSREFKPMFVVDKPFYLWINREDITYFAGYFDKDSWVLYEH
jgi:hypothetical protein